MWKSVPVLVAAWAVLCGSQRVAGVEPSWADTARRTHARFGGRPGTLAQFGDSITVTQAFWSPLRGERRNAPPALERAFKAVDAHLRPECWREWKGAEFGSEGGQTVRWADANAAAWLRKLNPEAAVILFGSNDVHSLGLDEYRTKLRAVVQRCLDNGTVVLLTTPPPQHGIEKKAGEFAGAVREIAGALKLPLIDYHAEILKRRPEDWNGALERFKGVETYEVPTLISGDGVHPSFPKRYQNDYSEEGLRSSGYTLRNTLTLLQYAEVVAALQAKAALAEAAAGAPPSQPWYPKPPPLPSPPSNALRASSAPELYDAASRVRAGGTIVVASGRYVLASPLEIRTNGVTLRGESPERGRVVLDGAGTLGEAIRITACTGVTIADLTVRNVRWNGIKINSETGVHGLRLYNCVLHNIWQRAVKGVKVPAQERERLRPKGCRIEYCFFYNDRPKMFSDDPADRPDTFNGDYIGGIDVMYPSGWVISDNVFLGIQGRTRQARGAVFLWHDARDCVVERNVIVDCDSGICLGNSSKDAETAVHCTGCVVRNNLMTRAPENGILADYTRDCKILHNTIYHPESRSQRGIRIVHDNDGLLAANNLLAGPKVLVETESRLTLESNVAGGAGFVDPATGNLRLRKPAAGIAAAVPRLKDAPEDVDRRPREARTNAGAHE